MNRRQKFLSESYYKKSVALYDETESRWIGHTMQADTPEQERSLRTAYFKNATLNGLFIRYTAGEPIAELPQRLDKLISDYEVHQAALAHYEQLPAISPLAIDDWPDQYEECVQVMSLCILLHRTDLLKRFTTLVDNAGYAGEDTLYEDLLRQHLPERRDVDDVVSHPLLSLDSGDLCRDQGRSVRTAKAVLHPVVRSLQRSADKLAQQSFGD